MASDGQSSLQAIERMLGRAHVFTEKLLAENARLRKAVYSARASAAGAGRPGSSGDPARVEHLEKQLAEAHVRLESLAAAQSGAASTESERVRQLETELADLRRRHAELEEQNNNLANLYVASYQLHSTLDFREVLAIVMEIVINLIGAEVFCIMLVDGKSGDLFVVTAEGMERRPTTRIKVGDGIIGGAARSGEAYYRDASEEGEPDFLHPLAAIPLKIKDHVIGVIAVHRLFTQKEGFTSVDYELFDMLAGHAATAIFSAKLYGESERKLTTIQSFLDLLTTS